MDKSKVNFSKPMLIQSVAFKDVFLRMDGKGISTTCGAGAGKVNCQRSMAPTGAFKVGTVVKFRHYESIGRLSR